MPAVHPAESQASRPLQFYRDAEMSRGHLIWHQKRMDQNSGVLSFVSGLLTRQGAASV